MVVHGIVLSSDLSVDSAGRPESVSVIEPITVLKGRLPGSLVLHQVGGTLPDGRFFQLWGKPEYIPGREVVVFAITRAEGEFQTAEMLLGKFEVWQDEAGARFAVPDLAVGVHPGVSIAAADLSAVDPPTTRPLLEFLASILTGAFEGDGAGSPVGALSAVNHPDKAMEARSPDWANIGGLWRYNNDATAVWSFNGTANITGGGTAEATGALAAWTNDPSSTINYTAGTGTGNVIYLNATSSALGCGWSTCLSGAGVIGCGGPMGGGGNSWRGESYATIVGGTVELRSYCSTNLYGSATTQAVMTHELGHTLGLGHSDQAASPHDTCRGDEAAAQMRSIVQNRTTLGTDDQDAIRWLYGDGGNHCAVTGPASASGISPAFGSSAGGTSVTISGSNFASNATVSIGGSAATVTSSTLTSIVATASAHAVGKADVVVTNPATAPSTLTGAFFYDFADVPPSNPFHPFVVKLFLDSIAAGCSGTLYCPTSSVTRGQMAVFLLKSKGGAAYTPPACIAALFTDVPCSNGFAAWINEMSVRDITAGCGFGAFCPNDPVTRAQMAVFLLRTSDGATYTPPPCTTAPFSDVPCSSAYSPWIQELVARGITSGCGSGDYCPNSPVTRQQMAALLVITFSLP